MAAEDANEYPIGYVKNGYVCVYVSLKDKAWKRIENPTNLEKEETIIEKDSINIAHQENTHRYLTDDMLVLTKEQKPKEKKASSEYHLFVREFMEKTDKTIPYKDRFKDAVASWHLHKSKRKQDITNS